MKYFPLVLLVFLTISCTVTKEIPPERVYLDELGDPISKLDFMEKWRDDGKGLSRWDEIEKGKRKISLSSPLFTRYSIDHLSLLRNLERITGQEFAPSSVLVIRYNYLDDLCGSEKSNIWSRTRIRESKYFHKSIRKDVLAASENVVYLHLFEEGITLKNKPDSKKEYFFQDKNNFLRETIFKHPTFCGSFALIKPNGQTLVRNGEHRADYMVEFLQPEYWDAFFHLE